MEKAIIFVKWLAIILIVVILTMSAAYLIPLIYHYLASGKLLLVDGLKLSDLINIVLVVISLGLAYLGFKIARDAVRIAEKANNLAVSEAKSNRKHNRLSVAPLLDVWCKIYPSDVGKLEVIIANNGLGPAVIEKLLMKKGDHIVFDSSSGSSNEWTKSLRKLWSLDDVKFQNDTQNKFHTNLLEKGAVIRSNDQKNLIDIYVADNKFNAGEVVSGFEVKVEVEVIYKSVYGDSYQLRKIL